MINKFYVKSTDVIAFPTHGGISLHHLKSDEYYSMEEGVASFVWDYLDGSNTIETIINNISKQFAVDDIEIGEDIVEFINNLIENKLIIEVIDRI